MIGKILLGLGVFGGGYALVRAMSPETPPAPIPPKSTPQPQPTLTRNDCYTLVKALPPDVVYAVLTAMARAADGPPSTVDPQPGAAADVLRARYPNVARCLETYPDLAEVFWTLNFTPPPAPIPPVTPPPTTIPDPVPTLPPKPTDCARKWAKLPADVYAQVTRLEDLWVATEYPIAARWAARRLQSLGYTDEAACLLHDALDPLSDSVDDCEERFRAAKLPMTEYAKIKALLTHAAITAGDVQRVADTLEADGYHGLAACVRHNPLLVTLHFT